MQFKWRPRLPVKLPDETIKVALGLLLQCKKVFGSSSFGLVGCQVAL